MPKTCKDCKHYRNIYDQAPYLGPSADEYKKGALCSCEAVRHMFACDNTHIMHYPVAVLPDFGCNRWESKE